MPHQLQRPAVVLQEAALVSSFAVLGKLGLYTLLHIAVGLPPQLSFTSGFGRQLLAGSFCAFCWAAGKLPDEAAGVQTRLHCRVATA